MQAEKIEGYVDAVELHLLNEWHLRSARERRALCVGVGGVDDTERCNSVVGVSMASTNGVTPFNHTGIAGVVEKLIRMTPGELATVARELAEHDPRLADGLADLLIDSVWDATKKKVE